MRSARDPGRPRQPSEQTAAQPMLATMELLGQRWILRALWELEPGPLGFLALRRRMGNCSSSMLSERLQQLQNAGMVEKRVDKSYELTESGIELGAALQQVWDWSERWSANLHTRPARGG